jgi:hypothetical protein
VTQSDAYRPGDYRPDRSRAGRDFGPMDRPAVEVWHPETRQWYPGRLRAWLPALPAPSWWAVVTYHVGTGLQHYRQVPAGDVRQVGDVGDQADEQGGR